MKLLGIGNALVDILIPIQTDELLSQLNLPKASMQLIEEEQVNRILEEIQSLNTQLASGGSASNTITGLSRLGVEVGFIGKTGKDFYGTFFEEDLVRNHVRPFLMSSSVSSGCAHTFISADGERTFGTYLGAAATLNAEELKPEWFVGCSYFYIEGYLIFNEPLIRRAVQLAKRAGCKIAIDMASYNVVNAQKEFFKEIITNYVDIVFANEEEAFELTAKGAEAAVEELSQLCQIAVVKVGAEGSWVMSNGRKIKVDAIVSTCIDTTGAGDLYSAGFLYGLVKGLPLEDCGRIGSMLAGKVVEVIGARIYDETWRTLKYQVFAIG